MSSTQSFLEFVLGQISELKGISYRYMMGEYVIYYQQKVIGGIYDDRFLLKPTKSAVKILEETGLPCQMAIPYPGGKEMIIVDIDDSEWTCRLIQSVAEDLPLPKKR